MEINILKDLWREMSGDGGEDPKQPAPHDDGRDSAAELLPDYESGSVCSSALIDGISIADSDTDGKSDGAFSVPDSDDEVVLRPWPGILTATTVDISAQRAQSVRKKPKQKAAPKIKVAKTPAVKKPAVVKESKKPAVVKEGKKPAVAKKACSGNFCLLTRSERGKQFVQVRDSVSKKVMVQVTELQAGDMWRAEVVAKQLAAKAEEGHSKEELKELRVQMLEDLSVKNLV